jgi:hypothetical protein
MGFNGERAKWQLLADAIPPDWGTFLRDSAGFRAEYVS